MVNLSQSSPLISLSLWQNFYIEPKFFLEYRIFLKIFIDRRIFWFYIERT